MTTTDTAEPDKAERVAAEGTQFLDPVVDDIGHVLVARNRYRAHIGGVRQ
jgi:hypothetical protein